MKRRSPFSQAFAPHTAVQHCINDDHEVKICSIKACPVNIQFLVPEIRCFQFVLLQWVLLFPSCMGRNLNQLKKSIVSKKVIKFVVSLLLLCRCPSLSEAWNHLIMSTQYRSGTVMCTAIFSYPDQVLFLFFFSPFIRTYFLLLDIIDSCWRKGGLKEGTAQWNIRPKTVGCLNFAALLL